MTYMLNRLPGLAVMLALLAPAAGHTEHPADHLHLSPDLTRLLQQEMQAIMWRMQYLSNEINRLNMLPQYLQRPLTPEELWAVDQAKEEWRLLQQRLQYLQRGGF